MSCECCDVGVQLRSWLLGIMEVANYVHGGDCIIDTVDENVCTPFIWFSRSGGSAGETLMNCGSDCVMSEIFYDIEIIDNERYLAATRRIAEAIRKAANDWSFNQRHLPFGDAAAEFYVQLIEVNDVTDSYIPKVAQFLPGITWTAMSIEITPV